MNTTTNAPDNPAEPADRIDGLVVMRESAMYDQILMEGMISQTIASVRHLPGAAELGAAGIDVVRNPAKYGGIESRVGKSKMVTVERDGVIYLYSMGSAATADTTDDDNAFVSELVKLVNRFRPKEVWVSAFTRLVRAAEYSGLLLSAMSGNVDMIHAESQIEPHTPNGKMTFQVLAMIASAERDYIVRRHTLGRVAQWKRGQWIPSKGSPPGYVVDEEGRLQLGGPEEVEKVRKALLILADPEATNATAAAKLGAIGLTTPTIQAHNGAGATVADARNPRQATQTLRKWCKPMQQGRYTVLWPNPFPGVTDFAGVPVEAHPNAKKYPNGALHLEYTLPLPAGGWADDATFDSLEAILARPNKGGGRSHRHAPPLSGMFRFTAGDFEHALVAGKGYRLLQRRSDPNARHKGWRVDGRPAYDVVGVVDRTTLHKSISDAVVEALRDGLAAELNAGSYLAFDDNHPIDFAGARRRAVKAHLEDSRRKLGRAVELYLREENSRLGEEIEPRMRELTAEVDRLEAELAELETQQVAPTLAHTFDSTADFVAAAIAALGNAGEQVPRRVHEALATVLQDTRFEVNGSTVKWQLRIRVPHPSGTVLLGPITGEVPNEYRPRGANRAKNKLQPVHTTVEHLASLGISKNAAWIAAKSPGGIITRVLEAHLTAERLPEGVDPEWAKHIIQVYTDLDFYWDRHLWQLDPSHRQEIYDAIATAGGSATSQHLAELGFASHQLRYMTRPTNRPSGDPTLVTTGRGPDRIFTLLDCNHCGSKASVGCITPETRPGVICPNCRRTPNNNSPVFPDFYPYEL